MWRKLSGYSLLSFSSFLLFTIFFHTMANAQTAPIQTTQPTITPTPTVFVPDPSPTLPFFGQTLPTQTPTPTEPPKPTITAPVDLEALFTKYAQDYGADKELLKKIARCESGFNATSNNSGMYLGMFQFSQSTWIATRNAMGLDPNPDLRLNAEESIKTAAYKVANGGVRAWPNCH